MMENRGKWADRAEFLQEGLYRHYWNKQLSILNQWYPLSGSKPDDNFYYWWQAHVIDVMVDGWERSGDAKYLDRAARLVHGLHDYNGDTFRHNYYDDMEWTALALLRLYDHTGDEWVKNQILDLWSDIQTAWNDHMGGGMSWKKDQTDYKNTPANAPASILAARLYNRFGSEDDLEWAIRIYSWNRDHLVDPDTGFVWDGVNRLGDGRIDKDWQFTYCQGVFIGAALELHAITGNERYLREAERASRAAMERFVDPASGMLPDEGIDDTGLFKGIFVRYLKRYIDIGADGAREWDAILDRNGEKLWTEGRMPSSAIIGPDWSRPPTEPVQLSVQLSGLMLAEALAGREAIKIKT